MTQNSADADTLSELLAEGADMSAQEIEREAEIMELEEPDSADSEPLEGDWEDSPAYQEY